MKRFFLLSSLAALSSASVFGAAAASGVNAVVTGDVGVNIDDNVTLANKKVDDVWFSFAPGFSLETDRENSFKANYTWNQYSSHSKLNSGLLGLDGNFGYDDTKSALLAKLGYHETAQNSVDTRLADKLVRKDESTVGLKSKFAPSPLSKVEASFGFTDSKYKDTAFNSNKVFEVPVEGYYEYSPKLFLGAGYRYRSTDLSKGVTDSKDNYFYFAADGELAPSIRGKVTVGLNERKPERASKDSSLGFDAQLSYDYSPKTKATVGFSNDYGVSGTGANQRNLNFRVGADSEIESTWNAGASVAYRQMSYLSGGSDDYYELEAHVVKTWTDTIKTRAGLTHRFLRAGGARSAGNFDNTVFAVAASVRF
jgi:hypothetical protein